MIVGNVPYGVSVVLAYSPAQRAEWLAATDQMLADWDAGDAGPDLGVDVAALVEYNREVAAGVRAQLAKENPA